MPRSTVSTLTEETGCPGPICSTDVSTCVSCLLSQVGVRKDEKRLDRVGQVEPFFGECCVGHAPLAKVNFEVPVCLVLQAQQVQECSELLDLRTRPMVPIQFMQNPVECVLLVELVIGDGGPCNGCCVTLQRSLQQRRLLRCVEIGEQRLPVLEASLPSLVPSTSELFRRNRLHLGRVRCRVPGVSSRLARLLGLLRLLRILLQVNHDLQHLLVLSQQLLERLLVDGNSRCCCIACCRRRRSFGFGH